MCSVDTLDTILLQGAQSKKRERRTRISSWSEQLGARLCCRRDSLPYIVRLVFDCCLLYSSCTPGAVLTSVSSSGISLQA